MDYSSLKAYRNGNTHVESCVQVKPVYVYVHSQHHQIGSAITALGTAFGDALDIGLCFVAFHLVLGVYLYFQPAWNIAAVVLLIIFEVSSAACGLGTPPGLLEFTSILKALIDMSNAPQSGL